MKRIDLFDEKVSTVRCNTCAKWFSLEEVDFYDISHDELLGADVIGFGCRKCEKPQRSIVVHRGV